MDTAKPGEVPGCMGGTASSERQGWASTLKEVSMGQHGWGTAPLALQDSPGTTTDLFMQKAVVGGGLGSHLVTAAESGRFDEHACGSTYSLGSIKR